VQEKDYLCLKSADVCVCVCVWVESEDQSRSLTVLIQDEGSTRDSPETHTVVHHAAAEGADGMQ